MVSPACSSASKDKSSKSVSIIVCRRLAPMFSTFWFTSAARELNLSIASSVNLIVTSSVSKRLVYCFVKAFFGSVKIRLKSSALKDSSSTRSGKRPCHSGIKSLGFETLKAPAAIKRMWVVSITPNFVFTFEPSTIGKISR